MKIMQSKVNEMYDDYKNGTLEIENIGEALDASGKYKQAESAFSSVQNNNKSDRYIGILDDYRYVSSEDIKNGLDVDGVDSDFILNIKTRTVILLDGIKKDGVTYYSIDEIDEEQYNVNYIDPSIKLSPNGGTYYIPKGGNITVETTLTLIDKPEGLYIKLEYVWSTDDTTAPASGWTTFSDGTTINLEFSNANKDYLWIRITDQDNSVLYEKPSNAFRIKDTPLHTDVEYAVEHWQQNINGNEELLDSTNYTLKETDILEGTESEEVTPEFKTYEGFTPKELQTGIIAEDGSTVLNCYYTRNKYTLTIEDTKGISVEGAISGDYYYGETITLKAIAESGYSFTGWTSDPNLLPNQKVK